MANRVLQFPVRNAFAPRRSPDSLDRDCRTPSDHAHRIAQQVDEEISRQASRPARAASSPRTVDRRQRIVTMPAPSRISRVRSFMASAIGTMLASMRVFNPR